MKKTLRPLVIFAVTALILAAAYYSYSFLSDNKSGSSAETEAVLTETALPDAVSNETTASETTSPQTGEVAFAADDFTVYDADGNAVSLSSFAGKPILLNFWASWCGPCKREMPELQAAYEKYGGDIQFVMVNLTSDDNADDVKKLLEDGGYTFPVYYDNEADGAYTYGIRSIPSTFFLDGAGNITAKFVGAIDGDSLAENLEALIR